MVDVDYPSWLSDRFDDGVSDWDEDWDGSEDLDEYDLDDWDLDESDDFDF